MKTIVRAPLAFLVILMLIAAVVSVSCDSGDNSDDSQIISGCSPVPVATAPDLILCASYSQEQLETAINAAGGGCACNSECPIQTVTDKGNGSYLLTCSNECGFDTDTGKIGFFEWLEDWDEAITEAEAQEKSILINFYTQICPACRALDKNTFADKSIATFMCENFINVKLDASKSSLSAKYGISGVPATLITTPDGTEIGRISGYYPPKAFMTGLERAMELWNEMKGTDSSLEL
jgi:thioredoxin-related protein